MDAAAAAVAATTMINIRVSQLYINIYDRYIYIIYIIKIDSQLSGYVRHKNGFVVVAVAVAAVEVDAAEVVAAAAAADVAAVGVVLLKLLLRCNCCSFRVC